MGEDEQIEAAPVAFHLEDLPQGSVVSTAGAAERRAGTIDRQQRSRLNVRLAFWSFVAAEVAAFPLLMWHFSANEWFRFADDLDFLVERRAGSLDDLLAPHTGHWVTLPVLAYRALFQVVGFEYSAYLAMIVALHLMTAALLRVLMRRAGVGPWIATITAVTLIVFGAGRENIFWSFQVTLLGALVLGLAQLMLSDHDGQVDRRDWLGLGAGALALMCSGLGPVMVVVVGVATWLRRGWRIAAFHALPLAGLFTIWYLPHRQTIDDQTANFRSGPFGPGAVVSFVWSGLSGAFRNLGSSSIVGLALAVLLVVGLVVAWAPIGWSGFRRAGAAPAALGVGAVLFLALTSYQRSMYGSSHADESRYLYLVVAMLLPAIGVAADALVRRWRPATLVVGAILLLGVPANVRQLDDGPSAIWAGGGAEIRAVMATVPRSPLATQVPEWVLPEPGLAPTATVGWLLEQEDLGTLPSPGPAGPKVELQLPVRLGFALSGDLAKAAGRSQTCQTVEGSADVGPRLGEMISTDVPVAVTLLTSSGQPTAAPVNFRAPAVSMRGLLFEVTLADLHLRIAPLSTQDSLTLCSSVDPKGSS